MNNSKQKKKIANIVDEDGVILSELYQGDKIVKESQSEYREKYYTNFKQKELFVKVYINPLIELWNELTIREYAIATALIPYISYKDGILRNEGNAINIKDISSLLSMDYDAIRKIFPVLEKKYIISKIRRKSDKYADKEKTYIAVNPYLFLRGTDMEKEIADLFKDSKWAASIKE